MGAPNASGLTRIAQKLKDKFAAIAHNHAASDITSGTLALARGGTGSDTAAGARTNLDAAQSNGASGTLALAETAIGNLGSSIATVEQTTATANHAAGDYFVLGNVLMRATSAIATGEQITASNAVPATLQSQIDTLRDSVGLLGQAVKFSINSWETGFQFDAWNSTGVIHALVADESGVKLAKFAPGSSEPQWIWVK